MITKLIQKGVPEEDQLKAYNAIFDYAFEGTETHEGIASAIFLMAKPQIDANNKRHSDGCKGGRPPKESKTIGFENDNHRLLDKKPNVNVNENENENEKPLDGFFDDPELNEAFNKYLEICRSGKKCDFQAIQKKLYDLGKGDVKTMTAILNQSIAQGWTGLFELKKTQKDKKNKIHDFMEREYDFDELEKSLLHK